MQWRQRNGDVTEVGANGNFTLTQDRSANKSDERAHNLSLSAGFHADSSAHPTFAPNIRTLPELWPTTRSQVSSSWLGFYRCAGCACAPKSILYVAINRSVGCGFLTRTAALFALPIGGPSVCAVLCFRIVFMLCHKLAAQTSKQQQQHQHCSLHWRNRQQPTIHLACQL